LRKIHYGWIIVAISSVIFATNGLAIYGFGVFLTPLTEEFTWDRGELSAAFSAGILVAGLLSTITGRISDRYGPRVLVAIGGVAMAIGFLLMSRVTSLWQVYLIWGVFLGVGIGGIVTPINTTIPRWFSTKTGIAVAIPSAGFGVGSVLAPLLVQWLLTVFDWRLSFVVLGGIRLVITLPLALFMRRSPRDVGLRQFGYRNSDVGKAVSSPVEGTSFMQAMKSRRFWFFAMTHFGFGFYLQMIIVHTVPNAIDVGMSAVVAASILSIVAATSILGMLSAGFVSDRLGGLNLLSICLFMTTLAVAWLIFASDVWMLYLFAAVFGFFYGGAIPLWTIVSAQLFGFKSLGSIFGTVILLGTIGGAIGTPVSGLIFDLTGSYNIAFIIAASIGVLTIVFVLLLRRYRQKVEQQKVKCLACF
jgi:MFS family permease